MLGDPLLDRAHRRRLETACADAADLLGADQAALLQHVDVLDDGRQRHRERLGELADRGRALAQPGDDRAPARVGEGTEGPVERGIGNGRHDAHDSNS